MSVRWACLNLRWPSNCSTNIEGLGEDGEDTKENLQGVSVTSSNVQEDTEKAEEKDSIGLKKTLWRTLLEGVKDVIRVLAKDSAGAEIPRTSQEM